MNDKHFAQAIRTMGPLACSPHAGDDNPAMALLEKARAELAAQPKSETAAASPAAAGSQ